MPENDSLTPDPVIGDGVITFTPNGEPNMAADLAPEVAAFMTAETVGNIQNNNRQGRDTFTTVSGALQAGVAKTLNELGPVESRAVSGVLATPVAGPTTG